MPIQLNSAESTRRVEMNRQMLNEKNNNHNHKITNNEKYGTHATNAIENVISHDLLLSLAAV